MKRDYSSSHSSQDSVVQNEDQSAQYNSYDPSTSTALQHTEVQSLASSRYCIETA